MALSGFILTDREKYLVEKMINDVKMAVARANLYMLDGTIVYKDDSTIDYLTLGIFDDIAFNIDIDDIGDEEVEQGQRLNFYIESVEEKYADDQAFDWIPNGNKLYQVAYVEKIRNNKQIMFKFIHEYLKLNPKDYFWVEDDWVYTLDDMERLSKLPFDECWCYKNPNDRDTI